MNSPLNSNPSQVQNSNVPAPVAPVSAPVLSPAAGRDTAVQTFVDTIGGLYEKDYGDFQRKASLYMERMRVDLGRGAGDTAKILELMKTYLVYAPTFDIEATRLQLLRDADEIRRAKS